MKIHIPIHGIIFPTAKCPYFVLSSSIGDIEVKSDKELIQRLEEFVQFLSQPSSAKEKTEKRKQIFEICTQHLIQKVSEL